MHQVGRQTKGGIPVARERRAIDDIQKATVKTVEFHPYNKQGDVMGHQVNFFALPVEIAEIREKLESAGDFLIIRNRSETAVPDIVGSFEERWKQQPWLYFCLVRRENLQDVVTCKVGEQDYWTVDVTRSPVVEFHRPFFDNECLRRGRAYFVDGIFGPNGEKIDKPDDFTKWAKRVLLIIRKSLCKRGSDYIGEQALDWLAQSRTHRLDTL